MCVSGRGSSGPSGLGGRCGHAVVSASVVVSTQGVVPFRRLAVLQTSRAEPALSRLQALRGTLSHSCTLGPEGSAAPRVLGASLARGRGAWRGGCPGPGPVLLCTFGAACQFPVCFLCPEPRRQIPQPDSREVEAHLPKRGLCVHGAPFVPSWKTGGLTWGHGVWIPGGFQGPLTGCHCRHPDRC